MSDDFILNDNFFDDVAEIEPHYADTLKTGVTHGPPKHDPEKWYVPGVRDRTNCLTYAMNLRDRGQSRPGYLRMPVCGLDELADEKGRFYGKPYVTTDAESISGEFYRQGFKHDKIDQIHEHGGRDDDHVMAVFYRSNSSRLRVDFDAYRKNEGGVWTRAKVRGEHGERNIIIEQCSFAALASKVSVSFEAPLLSLHAKLRAYPEFLGFFKMPKTFQYYPDAELVKLGLDDV